MVNEVPDCKGRPSADDDTSGGYTARELDGGGYTTSPELPTIGTMGYPTDTEVGSGIAWITELSGEYTNVGRAVGW